MNRVVGGRWGTITRETDGTCGTDWCLWIVKGIREPRSPDMYDVTHWITEKYGELMLHSPVTKITRDDTKSVLPREERRDDLSKSSFSLAIYRTDEDRNYGYIQSTGTISLSSGA